MEELEENGDFGLVRLGSIFLQGALAALCVLFAQLNGHVALPQGFGRRVLRYGVAVAGVTVHADAFPLRAGAFVGVLARAEVPIFLLELPVQPDDGHGVGGVAVVASDWSVSPLAHTVADLGKVELVQQVLVEARVLVDCVVLGVAVTWCLCWSVAELNLVVELDLSGSASQAAAWLHLSGGCRREKVGSV